MAENNINWFGSQFTDITSYGAPVKKIIIISMKPSIDELTKIVQELIKQGCHLGYIVECLRYYRTVINLIEDEQISIDVPIISDDTVIGAVSVRNFTPDEIKFHGQVTPIGKIETSKGDPFLRGPREFVPAYLNHHGGIYNDYAYNMYVFKCGSIVGNMTVDEDITYLVTVQNAFRHNGDFKEFLDAIENYTLNGEHKSFAVMDLCNSDLKGYLIRRGYVPFSKYGVDGVIKRYEQ